jgi:hypothetical protein
MTLDKREADQWTNIATARQTPTTITPTLSATD